MYPEPLPQNTSPYQLAAFRALPTGAVIPRGWLLKQLEVQASGITGHLDEYWPDVGVESGWLGGPGDDWERAPYYCDGLLPLAALLEAAGSLHGPRLTAKAHRYIDWMLSSRRSNGYFGPSSPDYWPRMVALKVLMSYYETTLVRGSPDSRVLELMTAYFHYMNAMLDSMPLYLWGRARGSDNLLAVQWLYALTGEPFLIELGCKIQQQTMDWPALQGRYEVEKALRIGQYHGNMGTHVVNNAQGIKTGAVWYVQTGDPWHRDAPLRSIENLMKHHGQANGIWSGDEHLNGTAPTAGTELCAVVEFMYSLEEILRITGETAYADQLELVAYNALPAAFKKDMWAHQYDQQVNQVLATRARRAWTDNGDELNMFGQTPNFGCCQANFHQGWPKLARSLVMATADGGLALTILAPCEARAHLPSGDVRLIVETNYPFDGLVVARIELPAGARLRFPLSVRVPVWAEGASAGLCVPGQGEQEITGVKEGEFLRLEREWGDGEAVLLHIPMRPGILTGPGGLYSVYRGPLLFGLHIKEEWRQVGGSLPAGDWEVYPASPWNYGLSLPGETVSPDWPVHISGPGALPFEGAPVTIRARGRRIPSWGLERNSAGNIGPGPHPSTEPEEDIILVPYGATCLRIGAFPLVSSLK